MPEDLNTKHILEDIADALATGLDVTPPMFLSGIVYRHRLALLEIAGGRPPPLNADGTYADGYRLGVEWAQKIATQALDLRAVRSESGRPMTTG